RRARLWFGGGWQPGHWARRPVCADGNAAGRPCLRGLHGGGRIPISVSPGDRAAAPERARPHVRRAASASIIPSCIDPTWSIAARGLVPNFGLGVTMNTIKRIGLAGAVAGTLVFGACSTTNDMLGRNQQTWTMKSEE